MTMLLPSTKLPLPPSLSESSDVSRIASAHCGRPGSSFDLTVESQKHSMRYKAFRCRYRSFSSWCSRACWTAS
eukprot:11002753-Heterocapsa_arctica.AAC.1